MTTVHTDDDEGAELGIETKSTSIPLWLLLAPMSSHAKVIYCALHHLANSGEKMPGHAKLAPWLHGKSSSTVSRAITDLESYGAIRVRRDDPIATGPRGRMITRNAYFVRTSDPTIRVVMPIASNALMHYSTDALLHQCTPSSYEEDNSTTSANTRRRSFKAVVVDIDQADLDQLPDLLELAAQCRTIRTELGKMPRPFADVHVAEAVRRAIAAGHPVDLIGPALLAVARDPETRTPYRLASDTGRWWDDALAARRRQHRADTAQQLRTAIDSCERCDEYGWLLPDVTVKCDHQVVQAG